LNKKSVPETGRKNTQKIRFYFYHPDFNRRYGNCTRSGTQRRSSQTVLPVENFTPPQSNIQLSIL